MSDIRSIAPGPLKRPVLSVITVTLNDKTGLVQTIDSVKAQYQCCESIEHIIIDGGSIDGSVEILRHYNAPYRVEWVSEPDAGIFDAMNKGARIAQGDVFVFMNSADKFTTKDTLGFVAQSWKSEGWAWGYGAIRYVNNEGQVFKGQVQAPFNPRKLQLGMQFVPHQSMYVTRTLFERLGGYRGDFRYAGDQEFAIRAAKQENPTVWIRFMSDFLAGGTHEQTTAFEREFLYHKMRSRSDCLFAGSLTLDTLLTCTLILARYTREKASRVYQLGTRAGAATYRNQQKQVK